MSKDKGKSLPYNVRNGIVALLISKMHVHPLTAVREMVSNAIDQYSNVSTFPIVKITIDSAKKRFKCKDYATGILDMDEFCAVGNEEPELCKVVGDRINTSTNIDPKIIGQNHIAKMSYVDCSNAEEDRVIIRSNNGIDGDILYMRQLGWGEPEHFRGENRTIALPHVGLELEVLNAKDSLLMVKRLYEYLSDRFGILLARKLLEIEMFDIGHMGIKDKFYRIQKPSWLKVDNEVTNDPLLKLKSGRYVTCRLEHTAKAQNSDNIYVFVKYVGICTIHVDYLVSGWINCDELTNALDTSRDRLIADSDINKEVLEKLNNYLEKKGYVKQERSETKEWKPTRQMNEIAALAISEILKDLEELNFTGEAVEDAPESAINQEGDKTKIQVNVEKRNPSDVKQKPRDRKPNVPTGIHRKLKTIHTVTKLVETTQRNPKTEIIPRAEGIDKPTTFFENAERLIINTSQDDSKMIMQAIPSLRTIALIPFVAEAAIDLKAKYTPMSIDAWKEDYRKLRKIMWLRI